VTVPQDKAEKWSKAVRKDRELESVSQLVTVAVDEFLARRGRA